MSNRQILYLLMGLTALAFGARMWATAYDRGWEEAVADHERLYSKLYSMVNDIAARREKAPKGTDERAYRKHFQSQAYAARMGTIDVQHRTRTRGGVRDDTYTIEFTDPSAAFTREQVRLFLYNSELLFPRLRTTLLDMLPAPPPGSRARNVETGADRPDLWKLPKLEFTQRTPVGETER